MKSKQLGLVLLAYLFLLSSASTPAMGQAKPLTKVSWRRRPPVWTSRRSGLAKSQIAKTTVAKISDEGDDWRGNGRRRTTGGSLSAAAKGSLT